MERIAVYPGTFDPITNGHIDVIDRASQIFDKVYVAVLTNPSKKPLFSVEERIKLIKESLSGHSNIEVDYFRGLLVDYAKSVNARAIVRGLRAVSDFEYEFQMALVNRKISPELITVFLMPNEKYTYLNSTIVKEVASFQGNIKDFVPENIYKALHNKLNSIDESSAHS